MDKEECIITVLVVLAIPLLYPKILLEEWNNYYVRKYHGYILRKGI